MGGGRPGGGGAPPGPGRKQGSEANALDLSASLFSIAQGRSVALVGMEYSGVSADEAVALFSSKLAHELRGTTCAGWSWDAKVDAGHIRTMIDP
jgi:hypothetical protein